MPRTIQTDVLVCGGGCAGIGAALAAARNNARTLLVERAGFVGGIISAVGLPYFDGICAKQTGRFVARGIPLELLVLLGIARPDARSLDDCKPEAVSRGGATVRIPNIEQFKLLSDHLVTQHGAMLQPLYHSLACGVDVRDGRIAAVMVANKDGLTRIEAKQVIDCTGDADLAAWVGCPIEKTTPAMPMTLHFRIGHVKRTPELGKKAKQALADAHDRGDLPLFYGPGLIFCFADDEAYVHAVRVSGDATDAADLTRAEIQGRKDAWAMFDAWKKSVPGFENSYFITSGPYIGIRESRRIVGQYVLTADDLRASRRFDDAVATGCWYLDRHPNQVTQGTANLGGEFQPEPYDIPYRTLVPKQVANLLVAGRCHSASAEASTSTRVTVTAMCLGQAAGAAAAMAVQRKTDVAQLDGVKVREMLASQGAGAFT